jgi:type IV pilus assembly protein PilZ
MTAVMSQPRRADTERPGAERRAAPRVLVDLEVDYRSEDNFLFAYITDISETGIFIRTTTPEPPGTHLNLRFVAPTVDDDERDDDQVDDADELDDGTPFELEGEVIWVNPYRPGKRDSLNPGMGVRFLGLEPETRVRLMMLIRRIAYLAG